jgi:hypothetical protein
LAGTVTAFALPIMSVQGLNVLGEAAPWTARDILEHAESRSVWYAVLAGVLGLLLATTVWHSDHRGRHQYALSLPVPRWQFVMQRFGAGAVLLGAPVLAFAAGCLLAAASLTLPDGLQTYPVALSLRFALAAFVAYGVFFAISAATVRTAAYVLALVGAVLATQVLLEAAHIEIDLLGTFYERASYWPGPAEIFTGRWTLIDV